MSTKEISALIGFCFCFCFVAGLFIRQGDNSFKQPTHYHVACTDDIFSGEVIKKGKKYYLDSGQEIWIPLKECVLVEL